ncbi:MAG: hypothetical protein GKS01_01540 [Alphaproteobacteria bacterium]|nr:hypothetical protein [Alphaproteobacteria bacterium]
MSLRYMRAVAAIAVPVMLATTPVAAADKQELQKILGEIKGLKRAYENRIATLENKIKSLETKKASSAKTATPAGSSRSVKDNSFNPSIGLILNGRASSFSENSSEFAGFAVGEEGERGKEGLSIGESELNFSANVDDKFYGSATLAVVQEDGSDKIELEEVYIQTLPDAGLPDGLRLKAGRAFWTLGYLNEHHAHADDFADRPLPYRAFLNKSFNDDGVEVSYVVPSDMYIELGGGVFRGDDFPAGGSASGLGAFSAYARVGGDIGDNQSWRLGAYALHSDVNSRATGEGAVTFVGKSNIYAADIRYTWAPDGNAKNKELILQAEFFNRDEDGTYNDTGAGTGNVNFDDSSQGWYAQAVYKFAPSWRLGARYSQLLAADTPAGLVGSALDSAGHDPSAISVMGDWTNSEFGRIRLQYNREELSDGKKDNQFLVQYIMSIGAHGAHAF